MSRVGGKAMDLDFHGQSERLARQVNIDHLSFTQVMFLLTRYVSEVLLEERNCRSLEIDPSDRVKFHDFLARAKERKDDAHAQCEADRVDAWQLQTSKPKNSKESTLAEIVTLCMYDRESAEFDTFGPAAMIESIMTSIGWLGEGYCRSFVDFVIAHKQDSAFIALAG